MIFGTGPCVIELGRANSWPSIAPTNSALSTQAGRPPAFRCLASAHGGWSRPINTSRPQHRTCATASKPMRLMPARTRQPRESLPNALEPARRVPVSTRPRCGRHDRGHVPALGHASPHGRLAALKSPGARTPALHYSSSLPSTARRD
jgi:hypothetical protein